ncbi:MAG: hypothetical protein K5849_06970 [Bacteroidales bacterium]|nr:hypothetical protein [Bacteroidales bacterium]
MKRFKNLLTVLLLCTGGMLMMTSCLSQAERESIEQMADQVWTYSQSHPDGFTLHLRTMSVPRTGIVVAYIDTRNTRDRSSLTYVIEHSLVNDGYVGGRVDPDSGVYFFDSVRVFPETELEAAKAFGVSNNQEFVYILSSRKEVPVLD